jgi:hypothetical protein
MSTSSERAVPAPAGGEDPGPCGQHRRDVEHSLADSDQALGDVPADAVAAVDDPERGTHDC